MPASVLTLSLRERLPRFTRWKSEEMSPTVGELMLHLWLSPDGGSTFTTSAPWAGEEKEDCGASVYVGATTVRSFAGSLIVCRAVAPIHIGATWL